MLTRLTGGDPCLYRSGGPGVTPNHQYYLQSEFSLRLYKTASSLRKTPLPTTTQITPQNPIPEDSNMLLTYLATTLASLAALASASDVSARPPRPPGPPTPPTPSPGLTFLYSLNCTLGTRLPVGAGPNGDRVVIPITGGTFAGPRISGVCLPPLQSL